MKRSLALVCTVALLLSMIVPGVSAEDTTCPCCGAMNVTWTTMTDNMDMEPGVHYRLEKDTAQKKTLSAAGTYCIDLAGHTLSGTNRVFVAGVEGVVLNLMDSSAKQTGVIQGYGGTGNAGGLFYIKEGATINVYGGTIQPSTTEVVAYAGGIFSVYGTLNVYGGTIIGGKLGGTSTQAHVGANICVQASGAANFYGGTVISGTAESDDLGHCVYVKKGGTASISGNANVDQILFAENNASKFTVNGAFTGSAELWFPEAVTAGTVIATSNDATISGNLTVAGSDLAVMVSGDSVVVGAGSWCEACKTNVIWQELSATFTDTSNGHYKLSQDVSASQFRLKNGVKICLDLNGFTYAGSGRTLVLGASSSTGAGETLNVMDSSPDKTGRLTGRGGSDAMAGGVIYSYKNTFVNIYSGTVEGMGSGDVMAKNGGAIDTYGEINMYGGKIIGNHVAANGGTVCLLSTAAKFNVYGGQVISGKADGLGNCVYVTSGSKVKLSGDAILDEIYFAGSSASAFTVTGNYTGKAALNFATAPTAGTDIGNVENLTLDKESLTIVGSRMYAAASGSNLITANLTGAVIEDTYYDTLAAALSAAKAGDTVRLLESATSATASNGITLDLNGWNIDSLTANGTVFVKDSATDDFTVEDIYGYGKITTISGDAQPVADYLALNDNGTSFHRYTLKLSKVNLRPGSVGLYYTSAIQMNEAAQRQTDSYGVAVSVSAAEPTLGDGKSLYTVGNSSVLISNIMDGDATDAVDAATPIYGRPYIKFADGSCIYGSTYAASLQQITEIISEKSWANLSAVQHRSLMKMYNTYAPQMTNWKIENMATSAAKKQAAADDGVLKAIILGNSHSTDSTYQLAAILMTEAPEVDFVLGCMYESGCPLKDHVTFYENESPVYTYYKNCGEKELGAWTGYAKSTLQDGLGDENWDMVIFQDSCLGVAKPETFTANNNVETLTAYVVQTLGYEPQLVWHDAGGIPNIPENYANYAMGQESDDGGTNDGGENEGWENDGTSTPEDMTWIFDIARPNYPVAWAQKYIKACDNDDQKLFDADCEVLQKYVMNNETYNFSMIIPCGSAIQYARNMGMTDQEMFRDYAHRSDYARVIVAYVWYATLLGIDHLDELNYTTVPAAMRQKKFIQYGDLVMDERQYNMALNAVNWALANPYDSPTPVED